MLALVVFLVLALVAFFVELVDFLAAVVFVDLVVVFFAVDVFVAVVFLVVAVFLAAVVLVVGALALVFLAEAVDFLVAVDLVTFFGRCFRFGLFGRSGRLFSRSGRFFGCRCFFWPALPSWVPFGQLLPWWFFGSVPLPQLFWSKRSPFL